jgi:hypothetical protein
VQAKNPKDQYLLLKALNEAIVSLIAEDSMNQLDANHQTQVQGCVPRTLPTVPAQSPLRRLPKSIGEKHARPPAI